MHISKNEVKNISNDYTKGLSLHSIAKKYHHAVTTIRSLLVENDIKIKTKKEVATKYCCNNNYFDLLDAPEKVYWLGFIFADGCIYKDRLIIKLSVRDIEHLHMFKQSIGANHPIHIRIENHGFKKNTEYCIITIFSDNIIQQLKRYGVLYNKSQKNIIPKNIPTEYLQDFIRGYVDGDGSFYHSNHGTQKIFSVLGSIKLLKFIQSTLIKNCSLSKVKMRKRTGCYELVYGGNKQVQRIADWLYTTSTIHLERKKEKTCGKIQSSIFNIQT